jgi:putative component of membrane protein insertase Oxa1/YidC/SpoIIIJ protein YidD
VINHRSLSGLRWGGGLAVLLAAQACATDATLGSGTAAWNPIDARHITAPQVGRPAHTATRTYRQILAHSWGSHCRMLPTDSAYLDARIERCGAVLGVVTGFARLLLEIEASPSVLSPVPSSVRMHWLAPPPTDTCLR